MHLICSPAMLRTQFHAPGISFLNTCIRKPTGQARWPPRTWSRSCLKAASSSPWLRCCWSRTTCQSRSSSRPRCPTYRPDRTPAQPRTHRFTAPCTLPTMLYRLLKNVYHSLSTVLFSSFKSLHSGTQSSGLREEVARARDGSLPANTIHRCQP
jgi:hypothetical protein